MLSENAKIIDLVSNGLMRNSAAYVTGVLGNCYLMYQKRGWYVEHTRVRIGRIGKGTAPNYMLEYVSVDFDQTKKFEESQFNKRLGPEQYGGSNHQTKAIGFNKETWSTDTQTVATLEGLRERLKQRYFRLS